MRQRNIPVNDKINSEVQTDINLINQPITHQIQTLMQTKLYDSPNVSELLKAQTETQLLNFFKQEANFFRGLGSFDSVPQDQLRKRLLWIEKQIQGLEKRKLVVNGLDHPNYYNIVSDLQAKLDKQSVINNNYEPKLKEAQIKIQELQKQIQLLRRSIIQQQNYKTQNEVYEEAFKKISQTIKDPRKMRELQKTVNDTLTPIFNEYEIKLDAMMKNINNIGRATNDPKYKIKGHISGLLRNFDKIIKSSGQMTLQNVEKYIAEFLKELEISQTYQQYQDSKNYKQRYIDMERKFTGAVSIFKNKFETLLEQNPNLKNQLDFSIFNTLQKQGVNFYNYDKVIAIENGFGNKTVYYQSQQERTKKYLQLLISQLKSLVTIFPLIKQHLSAQIVQILNLQLFEDAIALDEIERLFQVVKYKTDVVKVENVYTYNNQQHLKTIFHLKIMVKALLDQLSKVKQKTGIVLEIDQGMLGMIRSQILEYINPDDVLKVFRTCPKIVEVQKIVERDLTRYNGILTETRPLTVQSIKLAQTIVQKPVVLKQQVGVIVEKGIPLVSIHQKPLFVTIQKAIEVPVQREVIVDRVIVDQRIVEVDILKQVPMIKESIKEVEIPVTQQIIVEVPQNVRQQVPVVVKQIVKQVVEVERLQEKLVQVVKQITQIKEVKITEQVPVEITKYKEVQKIVNNFVDIPQIIQVKEQVPITITNTIEKPVQIIQIVQKIVQVKSIQERIVEVPVQKSVTLIQQVPKPYKQSETIFVKGDKEQVFVEVQKIIQKPIIQEKIIIHEVQKQKVVPLVIKQQKPIIIELKQPYIQNQVQIITCQVQKVVPYKHQIPIQITKQVPVHIVSQKQIVKPIRVIVEKVIEKIVEVPRVVEVQKIVEKIVVVPRVVQNIVMVPQIVQKIVQREVEVLKIIEVQKLVPHYIYKQVQQIVEQRVEVPVQKIVFKTVQKQKLLVTNTSTELIKEVEVERRIPYEVIVQKPIPTIEEKIVQRIVTLNNVEVKQKEVMVPVKYEVPVELINQKAVEVKKIIQSIVQVPQIVTKNVVLYETKTVAQIHEIVVEKPIEKIKQVIFTNTNNIIQTRPEYTELIKEVMVKETERIEVIKPQPYLVEKIVVVTNTEKQAVEVKVEKGVPYRVDNIVVVEKPVTVPVIHQVPKTVNVQKVVQLRTIHESLKQVPIEGKEKLVTLQNIRPEVVEMTKEIVKVLVQHQQKQVYQQIAVVKENTIPIQVPTKPIVVHEIKQIYKEVKEPLLLEKVVERITVLPQIVEVLKHIHEITDQRIDSVGLGIAEFGVDVQVHTANYIDLCSNLKKGLEGLLLTLKNATTPEVKAQVIMIGELVTILSDLIRFPNIIQVPKQVQKIIEVQKPIVIHSRDNQTVVKEIASNSLIEKLLAELMRVKEHGVQLRLDDDILNTFFIETKGVNSLKEKLGNYGSSIINKFKSLGDWTEKHSLMLGNILQERFLTAGLVKESNIIIDKLRHELETSETSRLKMEQIVTKLNILNLSLKNSLVQVVESLRQRKQLGSKDKMDSLLERIKTTLSLVNTQNTDDNRTPHVISNELQLSRKKITALEKQIESYRGGEGQRLKQLNQQNKQLKSQLETTKLQNSRLRTSINQTHLQQNSRERLIMTTRVQDMSRLLTDQKQEYDTMVQRLREQFERRLNERSGQGRVITSTINKSDQQERQRKIIKQLQNRIRELEQQLASTKNRQSRITVDIQRKNIQYDELKKKLADRDTKLSSMSEASSHGAEEQRLRFTLREQQSAIKQLKDKLGRSTTELITSSANVNRFKSDLERSELQQSRLTNQLRRKDEEIEGLRTKMSSSQVYSQVQKYNLGTQKHEKQMQSGNKFQSPNVRQSSESNPDTPAAQLKMISPEIEPVQYQFSESSGTDKGVPANIVYRNLTLADLILQGSARNQNISSRIIIKVCEKIQANCLLKLYLFYTPSNIKLIDYSDQNLDNLTIELGSPIKVREADTQQKKYLPPEALSGVTLNERSCVFNVGLIWDEMINGELFFKNHQDIESSTVEFKVRNSKLNPIFKNSLFEMLAKQNHRRQDFNEIKRRLSLQRYITSDDKKRNS